MRNQKKINFTHRLVICNCCFERNEKKGIIGIDTIEEGKKNSTQTHTLLGK